MWVVIHGVSKIGSIIPFIFYTSEIFNYSDKIFKKLEPYPDLELVVVMVFMPFLLNTLCFWIQDSFLKENHEDIYNDKRMDGDCMECIDGSSTAAMVLQGSGSGKKYRYSSIDEQNDYDEVKTNFLHLDLKST